MVDNEIKSKVLFDICNKLNVKSENFLAYIGSSQSEYLFPEILDSIKAAVLVEGNVNTKAFLKKSEQMQRVKFVDRFCDLDESAFDRIVCFCERLLSADNFKAVIDRIICSTDNRGLVLLSGVPHNERKKSNGVYRFSKSVFDDYLESKGIFEVWYFESYSPDCYDIVFRVEKY